MLFGAIYREVSCSFLFLWAKLHRKIHFYLSVQIDCTDKIYLCNVELKMNDYGIT